MRKKITGWLSSHRILIYALLIALFLRLVLSRMEGSGDINNHIVWARELLKNGAQGFYEKAFRLRLGVIEPNYPPLSIALFALLTTAYDVSTHIIWSLNLALPLFPSSLVGIMQNPQTLSTFMRLPAILADAGIGVIVYLFVLRFGLSKRVAFLGASAVLFNPAFFYTSAIWGQIESVPLFFVLAAFYTLFYQKAEFTSVVLLFLAFMTKQTATIFVPLFMLLYVNRFGVYRSMRAIGVLLGLTIVVFYPFKGSQSALIYPFVTYSSKILTASGLPYASNHAFNLWGVVTGFRNIVDSHPVFLGLSYNFWGITLYMTLICIACVTFWKNKKNIDQLLHTCFVISVGSFIFLTRMHERHLEMALPFLLLMAVRQRTYRMVFGYVCLFHLFNLYHNRWQPALPGTKAILSSYPVMLVATFIFLALCVYTTWTYSKVLIPTRK